MTTPAPAGQSGYETTTYTYDGDGNLITTRRRHHVNRRRSQVTVNTYNAGRRACLRRPPGTAPAAGINDHLLLRP